jgi:mannose-6-phosphate isomerase-like protein (cupin superfamily)
MSNYTIKNLMDVEPSNGGPGEDLEVRLARRHLDSAQLGVSYFRYGPGKRTPIGHRHEVQEEAYVVISGSGRVKLDDEFVELRRWDVVRVAPEVGRAFEGGPDGLELVIVGGPRPESGDGAKVDGFWEE